MKELEITAITENLPEVLAFVDRQLSEFGCTPKTQAQINVAVEEVFVNIANYAYAPDVGPAVIRVETFEDPLQVILTFVDRGVPYDPLKKPDPDVSQPLKDRALGGLGIFMVKQMMDDVQYEYRDGKNILTFRKNMV